MKKVVFSMLCALFVSYAAVAQGVDSLDLMIQQIEQSLVYKTGLVELESGNATLHVPDGFRFLDKEQSSYVLGELWGNPSDSTIVGMIMPSDRGVLDQQGFAFVISFQAIGYVKDGDVDEINYDDLLKEMKDATEQENQQRIQQGFGSVKLIGWASKPFYDKELKVLHWANEMKFDGEELNSLNYNLKVLGRRGVLNINAVATMQQLPEVKSCINKIISSVTYKEGERYADFNESTDNVAAWTIGGLVAGKILAKAGFFALLLKFWKIILVGVLVVAGAIWKLIGGRKKEENKPEDTAKK